MPTKSWNCLFTLKIIFTWLKNHYPWGSTRVCGWVGESSWPLVRCPMSHVLCPMSVNCWTCQWVCVCMYGVRTKPHYVYVWKDRNLSLTSHRQLSTYSFEVYLVVLQTPSSPLRDRHGRGTGHGGSDPGTGVVLVGLVNSPPPLAHIPSWWNDWKIECCTVSLLSSRLFSQFHGMMLLTLTRNIKVTVQLMSSNWTKCQPCPINADTLPSIIHTEVH